MKKTMVLLGTVRNEKDQGYINCSLTSIAQLTHENVKAVGESLSNVSERTCLISWDVLHAISSPLFYFNAYFEKSTAGRIIIINDRNPVEVWDAFQKENASLIDKAMNREAENCILFSFPYHYQDLIENWFHKYTLRIAKEVVAV